MNHPLALPVAPMATRVFCGFRVQSIERESFFHELGHTFMPGTPLMQASLGLSAYLPAVLDPEPGSGLPDEVAIIVYSSLEDYHEKRSTSLSRRMYTHSHAAVFDMPRARAQFPGPIESPQILEKEGVTSRAWYLFDTPVDWQDGMARLVVLLPSDGRDISESAITAVATARGALVEAGCDQIVGVTTAAYAALWIHSTRALEGPVNELGLVPKGAEIFRDLPCRGAWVRGDDENGVTFDGPAAFCFRFSRHLPFFLDRNHTAQL